MLLTRIAVFWACVLGLALSGSGFLLLHLRAWRRRRDPEQRAELRRLRGAVGRPVPPRSRVSVVIPCHNEAGSVAQAMRAVEATAARPELVELVVVDAASSDGTAAAAAAFAPQAQSVSVQIVRSRSGRGPALNAGASAASGQVLLFLHADTTLPPRFDDLVRDALAAPAGGVVATAFRFGVRREAAPVPGLGTITAFANLRAAAFQLPYGDQALAFSAASFRALGRFPDVPMMEDFEIVGAARRAAFATGQELRILPAQALCSSRRWDKLGALKTTLWNQWLVAQYAWLGRTPEEIYEQYYGERC